MRLYEGNSLIPLTIKNLFLNFTFTLNRTPQPMNTTSSKPLPDSDHYIVAIGASAGGLEAIQEFFGTVPANGKFSFTVIQPLSPDYKSLLAELVAKRPNMKLVEAQQDVEVQNNCIYIIPGNKLLAIHQNKLCLIEKNYGKAPNTPIDTFLRAQGESQEKFRQSYEELERTKEEYQKLNIELEQKIKERTDELERSVEEFRFVTDFMPQMVWTARPDGYHDYFNKRWYDFTGTNFDEVKGEGWNPLLHPEDRQRTWTVWKHSLETGEPYEIEYRFRLQDGHYRWFLGRALPLRDEEGKIVKWFGTCTDIHDQKMMNDILEAKVKERTAELQKLNAELEVRNNELLQFASVASHDLKEPLRKIHMFSNLVKDRYIKNSDGASDYMDRIISASARMTKLINDLLTLTRLSSNGTIENTDLNRVVDEVISDLELAISEKNAVIEIGGLPRAEVVSGQMRQVFQNLISNSLKFSKNEIAPQIRVVSENVNQCAIDAKADPAGDFCRIIITDNGIGFDNRYSEKIFTIFQRLHTREQYDGTGIGLAITKKIIEKHNGIIAASSREGEGSEFIIVLPLKQEAPAEMEMSKN